LTEGLGPPKHGSHLGGLVSGSESRLVRESRETGGAQTEAKALQNEQGREIFPPAEKIVDRQDAATMIRDPNAAGMSPAASVLEN